MHISLGRARYSISRACTNASGKAYRFEEDGVSRDEGEEGKRSHDFLGREVTQLSRTRGDIVPKCPPLQLPLVFQHRFTRSPRSPPLSPPHRGRGIASLFFLELRRSTVGLPSPLLGERTRSERVSRKKGDSREYSGSLKRRTANQSSSTKESRGERRKKSINNHHHHRRSPRIFPSFVQPTTRDPPSSVLRGVRRTIPTRKFATEKETALITYEKGNSFPPPSLSVGFSEELRSPALY